MKTRDIRGKKPYSGVMTPKEVSLFLNLPLSTVYYFSERGIIKSFRIGKKWRYCRHDIETYLLGSAADLNGNHERQRREQREAVRINTSIDCSFDIAIPNRKNLSGKADILNISHTGVFLQVVDYEKQDGLPRVGDPIDLHFKLNTIFAPPLNLEMKGRVTRIKDDGSVKLAVRFRNVPKELRAKFMLYTGEKLE
ncbi:MAG: helix-turn-helix domain-containing protein [Candidatus Omnitrophica bacterium]|nr:helix-turn-helix domain-containing protein [Candidatus Omnitrophota bacterium]